MTVRRRQAGSLLRVLGLAFGLAVVVGGVVGQGILRTPGIVAGAVPEPGLILLLWIAGGLLILIDACAIVELGSSIPKAGGPYALARRAYGDVTGTVVGWADFLTSILVLSFLSVVFGEYCHRLGIGSGLPIAALSLLLIAVCSLINWTGTRVSGLSQTIFSAVKGAALILFVLGLFTLGEPAAPAAEAVTTGNISPTLAAGALLIAISAIVNTYGGWTGTIYFGEELVATDRNISRATFGGIGLVMLLYVGVNASLLHVLTPAEMAASELPAADAARQVFGSTGETLVTVLALVSIAAIANLYVMFNGRIGFAMARDRILPATLARTSASGTPRAAMIAASLVAATAAASGTYLQLVAVAVPLTAAIIASLDIAAIVMRLREPDLPRPFRMPLFPLPAVVGASLNLALLIAMLIDDPMHSLTGIGAAVLLGGIYACVRKAKASDAAFEVDAAPSGSS